MASEIRVNKIENRSGLGTVTFADTGVDLAGIVTATTFSGSGASLTSLPAAQVTGTLPAISGANLTNLAAANLTGTIADARFPATLPAASAANLTSIPAANVTGTLPALTAANLTNIPAANIVGLATAGFERSGGFGGGKLLQVVHYQTTTQFSTSSGSFVDVTNFNADIIPQTNSKVLVQVTLMSILTSATSGGEGYGIKILRDGTQVLVSGGMYDIYDNANVSGAHSRNRSTWTTIDNTPGGDGSTTLNYKIQIGSHNAQSVQISEGNMISSMTLFEIGA